MNPAELVSALADTYAEHADPDTAGPMAGYMRNQFAFFGIQARDRRPLDSEVAAKGPQRPDHHYIVKVVRDCWGRPEREFQYFAVDYLRRHHRRVDPGFLGEARELVVTRSWWDTVDALAAGVVGPIVRIHSLHETMDRWILADNTWVIRAALLHQLAAKEETDVERLFTYARQRSADTDIFIRKAIGWSLRQHARTDPDAVRRFIEVHGESLSPLTVREATTHL